LKLQRTVVVDTSKELADFRQPRDRHMTLHSSAFRSAFAASVLAAALSGAPPWLPAYTLAAAQNPPRADQGVAARQEQTPNANPQATALAEFQSRLQKYIDLRASLAGKIKPMTPTASSA
jgi:hypothetical protein